MRRLLVISDHIQDPQILHDAANPTTRTVELCYETDDLASLYGKMADAAGGSAGTLCSVAFMDHGHPGSFDLLEGLTINLDELHSNLELRDFFKSVGKLLLPDHQPELLRTMSVAAGARCMGRIDLLCCSVAKEDGKKTSLIVELEKISGFNVCASTDVLGNPEEGGNWLLETDGIDSGCLLSTNSANLLQVSM